MQLVKANSNQATVNNQNGRENGIQEYLLWYFALYDWIQNRAHV